MSLLFCCVFYVYRFCMLCCLLAQYRSNNNISTRYNAFIHSLTISSASVTKQGTSTCSVGAHLDEDATLLPGEVGLPALLPGTRRGACSGGLFDVDRLTVAVFHLLPLSALLRLYRHFLVPALESCVLIHHQ